MNWNFTTQTRVHRYNNIWIYADDLCAYAVHMLEEYYSGPGYDGTVFLTTPSTCFDFELSHPITRDMIHQDTGTDPRKVIFLNFDHLFMDGYAAALSRWIEEQDIDEVWEWQVENYIHPRLGHPERMRFMPLRYVTWYEERRVDLRGRNFLCSVVGSVYTERRQALTSALARCYAPYQILSGHPLVDMKERLADGGFMLNIHSFPGNYREQLRISECLCLGLPVMTEKDDHPYYGDLVLEYDYDAMRGNVYDFIGLMDSAWYHYAALNLPEEYRRMTQSPEAYETYRNRILASAGEHTLYSW